jgi:hypothetical protein
MIRHKQYDPDEPIAFGVPVAGGTKHKSRSFRAAELIHMSRTTTNCDKKQASGLNP